MKKRKGLVTFLICAQMLCVAVLADGLETPFVSFEETREMEPTATVTEPEKSETPKDPVSESAKQETPAIETPFIPVENDEHIANQSPTPTTQNGGTSAGTAGRSTQAQTTTTPTGGGTSAQPRVSSGGSSSSGSSGRSYDDVVRTIGASHAGEIINLDGLDVPQTDASVGIVHVPFVDIAADAYYTKPVAWAYSNGVTDGVTKYTFGPNQTCTRAQMVTFLWRAAGKPEPKGGGELFPDVTEGSWYEKPVRWAIENGITNGENGRFNPDGVLNRAQAVTFLYRAQGKPAAAADTTFGDVPASAWYAAPVAWAVEKGVTNGVGRNAFGPDQACVRAQTVTFLYRTFVK